MKKENQEIFSPNRFKERAFSTNEANKYLFANNQNEFAVHELKGIHQRISLPVYPHRNTVTQLFFICQGSSKHTCGIDQYELSPNAVFIIPQGYLTSIEHISENIQGYYCHFDFSLFPATFVENLQKSFPFLFTDDYPNIPINTSTSQHLKSIFNRLIIEDSKGAPNFTLIGSYLITAFHEIAEFFPKKRDQNFARHSKLASDFKELLYTEIKRMKTAKEFADKLSVSPNHLNKSVKASTGKTVKQLMTEALLLEAKNLLHETDLSINEIAFELGIEDPAYFSRIFKQHTATSPLEYRKMIEKSK